MEEEENGEEEEEAEDDDDEAVEGTVAIQSVDTYAGYTDVRGGAQPMPSISRRSTTQSMPFSLASSIQSKSKPYVQTPEYIEEDDDDDEGYNTGDAVDVVSSNAWNRAIITQNMEQRVTVRIVAGPRIHDEISVDLMKDSHKIRFAMQAHSPAVDMAKKRSVHSPPPSLDSVISKQSRARKAKGRKLPQIPLFGAPLGKQRLTHDIPYALVVLKQYLFEFNGAQYEGIFANGSVQNITQRRHFVEGIVSRVDVNGVKKLVETGKLKQHKFKVSSRMEETHYAMVFSELIKLWLVSLPEPILQDMPLTFFEDIGSDPDTIQMECDKILEPNLPSLLFIWD
eukprot:153492_1